MSAVSGLVLAADHPWRFDLSSSASIGVAVCTLLLAIFTWRLARQTRSVARETEEDVRAEWRPVLIPESSLTVTNRAGSNHADISIKLLNVGRGPAINIRVTFYSETSTEKEQSDPMAHFTYPPGRTIDVGLTDAMLYRDSSGGDSSRLIYKLTAIYDDLSGRSYKTVLDFEDPDRGQRSVARAGVEGFSLPPDRTEISIQPRSSSGRIRRLLKRG